MKIKCLISLFQNRTLLLGAGMCGLGISMMILFLSQDFMTYGFVQISPLMENTNLKSHDTLSAIFYVNDLSKPVKLTFFNPLDNAQFNVRINSPTGDTIYNNNLDGTQIQFIPKLTGEYTVILKNLSVKPTIINVNYGYAVNHDKFYWLVTILWISFLIGGNYILFHQYLSKYNERKIFTGE